MAGILIGMIAAFIAVVAVRTIRFTPKPQPALSEEVVEFDKDKAVDALAQLVRCKTVSYNDHSLEDDEEFAKLEALVPALYPNVVSTCTQIPIPDRALLFRWAGKNPGDPTVLMAHYDVVPVNEEKWEKPPFCGMIEDGVLWGRGTLDTKVTFNGILSAADHLISKGFQPEQDIYLAFSGGEEVNGLGAPNIVQYFIDHDIHPALVVDEGGGVVDNVFPGVKQSCGLIGIAEKGLMNVQYRTLSGGGHASSPKPHTPVGVLAAACKKVEDHPFKCHIKGPAQLMFDTLGRYSTPLYRIIFANLWCFGWVLDLLGRLSGGEMNALMRTTSAFTQMEGSSARNVIPPEAKMVANMRLNPHDSVASATEYLKKTVGNPNVEITVLESFEPSPISEVDCPAWDKVAASVAETWRGCIVAPYLMVQCSDCRHYGKISNHVYRFSAMDLTAEERSTIHGNNERIRLEAAHSAVEFFIRLIQKC